MDQNQMSSGQIRKHLKQLKERQGQYLYYLGQLTYQAVEEGKVSDPGIVEAHRTLKDILTQIAQWEHALQQMKAAREAARMPKCPYCGAALMGGGIFCHACGKPLAAAAPVSPYDATMTQATVAPTSAPPAAPAAGKACPGCGAAVEESDLFCGECGVRLAAAPAENAAPAEHASQAEPVTAAEPVTPVEPAAPAEPLAEQVAPVATRAAATAAPAAPAAGTEAPVRDEQEEPRQQSPACPGCGRRIEDPEAAFCPECGTRIGK